MLRQLLTIFFVCIQTTVLQTIEWFVHKKLCFTKTMFLVFPINCKRMIWFLNKLLSFEHFFGKKKQCFCLQKKNYKNFIKSIFSRRKRYLFQNHKNAKKWTISSTEMIEILISFILKIVKLLMSVCRGISRCSSGRLLKRMRGALRAM